MLPERGSRTFTTSYDCFNDSAHCSDDFVEPDEMDFVRCMQGGDDQEVLSSPGDEVSHESFVLATPVASDLSYPNGEEDDEEDRQWEECMERRRMMFAMRSKCDVEDRQPEFEGYRSISAKLVEMLQSIEARRLPSPDEEDEEDDEDDEEEDQHDVSLQLVQEEDDEQGDGEEDEEPAFRSFASFTFTNLQSLHINPPSNAGLDNIEEASTDVETETDGENEAATPSLVSSSESEQDQQLVSPRAGVSPITPFSHDKERGRERDVVVLGAVGC